MIPSNIVKKQNPTNNGVETAGSIASTVSTISVADILNGADLPLKMRRDIYAISKQGSEQLLKSLEDHRQISLAIEAGRLQKHAYPYLKEQIRVLEYVSGL